MSRKGENIRKRKDGRWEARYIKERDNNGKILYGYLYGKTYREVKERKIRKLSELPAVPASPQYIVKINQRSDMETIGNMWKRTIRFSVKDSTYANYISILEKQILPDIGSLEIPDLTSQTISLFVQKKLEQDLSPGSIHVILSILKGILKYARNLGIYPREEIRFPKLPQFCEKVQIMDIADFRKLETKLLKRTDAFAFGILLCMNTGIRVGELSGLRWEDINFSEKKLQIRRTVIRIKNVDQIPDPRTNEIPKTILHIGSPKTANSAREIPLPDKLVTMARSIFSEKDNYILTGTPKCMEPRIIQRKYAALLNQYEIEPLKIHALRHQFSCRWVEQGFDTKSLSEILGHTSVKTTLDLYVHTRTEIKRNYINQLMEKEI